MVIIKCTAFLFAVVVVFYSCRRVKTMQQNMEQSKRSKSTCMYILNISVDWGNRMFVIKRFPHVQYVKWRPADKIKDLEKK